MSAKSHRISLEEIESLIQSQRSEEALGLLAQVEVNRDLTAAELIKKGRAIQLAEETNLSLDAAKLAFERALELDPCNTNALVELAWYYYIVEDSSQDALPIFQKALEVCRHQLTNAARGYAGCLAELKSTSAAAVALRNIHQDSLLTEMLNEDEIQWLESTR